MASKTSKSDPKPKAKDAEKSAAKPAAKSKGKAKGKPKAKPSRIAAIWGRVRGWCLRQLRRVILAVFGAILLASLLYSVINPPFTLTMRSERDRLGAVDYEWVPIEEIAPVLARSVVAAEDANFCAHWGFDMRAIRAALADGRGRGASTITQQVVKNAYLWQERSWTRKALEALMTPFVELFWSKERILEVYLNIAEFDEGVFGAEAAARHYFGVGPEALNARQAAALAAVLPAPRHRSASKPTAALRKRADAIRGGAYMIKSDGRAACFQD